MLTQNYQSTGSGGKTMTRWRVMGLSRRNRTVQRALSILAIASIIQWFTGSDVPGSDQQSGEKATVPQPIVRTGSEPGPTVLVVAGIHGNEPAGVKAAQIMACWSVRRGKLVVVSPANPPGVEHRQRTIPGVPKEEADLNRNFVVEGKECRPKGTLAQQLWQHVAQIRPDWLVDLHESVRFHKDRGVGNTFIVYPREETLEVVKKLLAKVNPQITELDERFVVLRWPARGSLARAAGAVLGCQSFILESTRQDPIDRRIAYHCEFVRALLEELQMGLMQ